MKISKEQKRIYEETIQKYKKLAEEKGWNLEKKNKNVDLKKKEKFYFTITLPNLIALQEALKEDGKGEKE